MVGKLGGQFSWQVRRLTTNSSVNGVYTLCGIPIHRPVKLTATQGDRRSRLGTLRLSEKDSRASLDLSIRSAAAMATNIRGALIHVVTMPINPSTMR